MRCLGSPRRAEDGEGIAPRGISPVVSGSLGKPVKLRPASWSWGGRPSRHLSRLLGLSRAGSRGQVAALSLRDGAARAAAAAARGASHQSTQQCRARTIYQRCSLLYSQNVSNVRVRIANWAAFPGRISACRNLRTAPIRYMHSCVYYTDIHTLHLYTM